jgi:Skp family chaperone for outer membrane proteins
MPRAGSLARAIALALLVAGPSLSQTGPETIENVQMDMPGGFSIGRIDGGAAGGVLTIDQPAFFEESAFGRASLQRLEERSRRLQAENRQIEEALEAEERSLTERRQQVSAEDFRALADAFDDKVEGIRNAQDAKGREIARTREADQQAFFGLAVPVLVELLREKGAVVLVDQSAIVLSLDSVDITAEAIARVNLRQIDPAEATAAPTPSDAPTPDAPLSEPGLPETPDPPAAP